MRLELDETGHLSQQTIKKLITNWDSRHKLEPTPKRLESRKARFARKTSGQSWR